VSGEVQSLVEHVIMEWNSGDTSRWRATFTDDATLIALRMAYPIEILRDSYEFFAALGHQLEFSGCVTADTGDVVCTAESTDRFADHLGLPPSQVELRLRFVDGLISEYGEHFEGANSVRSSWWEFADWIAEQDPDDARAAQAFPGDAQGARIALTYMDEYFESERPE